MKKTTTIKKNAKLANYSAVAGAVLATGAVNAQIQYNDINPDAVINKNNSPYNLDLNNDATNDVILGVTELNGAGTSYYPGLGTFTFTYAGSYAVVQAGAGAGVMGMVTGSSSTFAPMALNDGDAIGVAGNFGADGALAIDALLTIQAFSFTYPVTEGEWIGATDKFLGVRFTNAGNIHYGWVRMSVTDDASTITVKDYAYNTQATTAINAGQSLSLENVAVENKVTIRPMLDQAVINVTPDLVGGEIVIIDAAGKEVKSVAINDIDTTVDFNGLETGIYHISAQFEAGKVAKKIYVK